MIQYLSELIARHRFSWYAWGALLVLVTAAVTWLWAHEGHKPLPTRGVDVSEIDQGRLTISRQAREALDLQSSEVEDRPLPESVLAYATLVAPWQQHAYASSQLPGRITRVHVTPGQPVKAGQLLAEIESPELESLQQELLSAQNEVRFSEALLPGLRRATTDGATPEQTLLEAETKYQQDRNALEIARLKLLSVGLSREVISSLLEKGAAGLGQALLIRSPISGTLIHADLTVGRVVEPAEHLSEVIDLTKVWVKIGVLEKDLHLVDVGQEVELRLTAYPGETFRARVQVKGLHLDPRTHLNTVWAELLNPPGPEPRFLPGMSGQARVLLPATANARIISADALIDNGVERFVLVEEASATGATQVRKKNVVVTRQSPEWVEIVSPDLFPGDRVLARGSHELAEFFAPGVLRLSREASRTIGLQLGTAQPRSVEEVVELNGVVDVLPERRTFASALLAGTVQKIHIDRGQAVRAGDVIAEMASLEFQSLQLELLREHLSVRLLEEQFQRYRTAESALPQRKILDLESARNASRIRRDSLRRRLELIGLSAPQLDELLAQKKLVDALPVRAPIAGMVVSFDKTLGQALRAEEPLAEVHDLSRPWVQAFVSEGELARTRAGQSARVRFVSDPTVVLTGKVVRSGRVFAPESRTVSLWVELDQLPGQPLRHNQIARLSLTVRLPQPVLAVSNDAVVREGTRAFVFVRKPDEWPRLLTGTLGAASPAFPASPYTAASLLIAEMTRPEGRYERRPVETGRADDRHVEITQGLEAGEVVAVRGVAELQTAYASLR